MRTEQSEQSKICRSQYKSLPLKNSMNIIYNFCNDMKNPYEFTFDEYILFHDNIMKNTEKSVEFNESDNNLMSDEEFMKSHNLIPLDIFLKNINEMYGI